MVSMDALCSDRRGMTLVELALVLVLVGILTGAAIPVARVYFQSGIRTKINNRLEEAKKALEGYWEVNGYLPCPDTDGDGKENRESGGGARLVGTLPHADLGLPPGDGAGRSLTYAVLRELTEHNSVTDSERSRRCDDYLLASGSASLQVRDSGVLVSVPFVLVSGGPENKDGGGGYLDGENADGNDGLYEHKPADTAFDDLLVYSSPYSLARSGCGKLMVLNKSGGTHTEDLWVEQSFDGGTTWLSGSHVVVDDGSSGTLWVEAHSRIRVVEEATSATLDEFFFLTNPVTLVYDGA
ncbi:prepilin-type N-terminal cleavage/methylation domain-containing protein [Desulfacinum hydrothermale]|nr:prepilin-type N-terminal cleavage/methylation domain-containing protein [Desulfacinum hydrothermale]